MKKKSVYIFVLTGLIFMLSVAVYFINWIAGMNRTVSIVSEILFVLSLCGIFFFQWKFGVIFKEKADEKQLKALSFLMVVRKIWIVFILICLAILILKNWLGG